MIRRSRVRLSLISTSGCETCSTYLFFHRRGSISAEHGLGLMKADKITYTKDPRAVAYMQAIKQLFDPKHLLNPYKYLPSDTNRPGGGP